MVHALFSFPCALQFVENDSRWAGLRPKLAKWLCLCENYPYRMSFLVLVITDRAQKEMVNRTRLTHPSRGDKYGLVHYQKGRDKTRTLLDYGVVYNSNGKATASATASAFAKAEGPGLELDDDMPIVEAYFQHVERYIYSHPKARKMLSLDGDPVRGMGAAHPDHILYCSGFLIKGGLFGLLAQEVFTALLMQPVANLDASEANENQLDMCDITVADIIGPVLEKVGGSDRARDANFSLISYSYSLVLRSSTRQPNLEHLVAVPRLWAGSAAQRRR